MRTNRVPRILLLAAVGVAAAAVNVLTASPARADVFYGVGAISDADSSSPKTMTTECRYGGVVVGGGGYLVGGENHVHIHRWQPIAPDPGLKYPNTFTVTASEAEPGFAGDWQLAVFTICAYEPDGLEYISASSPTGSAGKRTATATCPRGKLVVGAGGRTITGDEQVILDDIAVSDDLTEVTVNAFEDENGYAGSWRVTAYAICVDPLRDQQLVSAETAPDSADKAVSVACPAGTDVHGMGGRLTGASGQAFLTGINAVDDFTTVEMTASEDATGVDGDWSARVYAICAAG